MSSSDPTRAPLTVIGGFLGAGKTTYLNGLIREGIPDNSLIVINDFGDINIDAELIDYQDEQLVQLTNGCICCTLGGTLAEQLAKAMRLQEAPQAVFIETSGVADPARIADIARVSNRLELSEVVCLVDGGQIGSHRLDSLTGETWRAQIQAATRILVNRLPDIDDTDTLLDMLRRENATAAIEDMEGERRLAGNDQPVVPPAMGRRLYHVPVSRNGWRSVSLSMPAPVDVDTLQDLLFDYGDVLLRAKGFLKCRGRLKRQLLQLSGGRLNWCPAPSATGRCQLVCIGRGGERFDALIARLECLGGKDVSASGVV